MENSEDPDEMAHYESSHLDLHWLQKVLHIEMVNALDNITRIYCHEIK